MSDPMLFGEVGSARLSDDGRYRYLLSRSWGEGPVAAFVMLNPSTADASADDPTIRRCRRFAQREGFGALHVVNLWPFRAADPDDLMAAVRWAHGDDMEQRRAFHHAFIGASAVIAAWGGHYSTVLRKLDPPSVTPSELVELAGSLDIPVWCLGRTKTGEPRHPLYLKADTELEEWTP